MIAAGRIDHIHGWSLLGLCLAIQLDYTAQPVIGCRVPAPPLRS
jgi:hypothetical protein